MQRISLSPIIGIYVIWFALLVSSASAHSLESLKGCVTLDSTAAFDVTIDVYDSHGYRVGGDSILMFLDASKSYRASASTSRQISKG